ncbi:MAG: hypothetical protein WBC05_03170 [Sedimentisphaerales bacterium]
MSNEYTGGQRSPERRPLGDIMKKLRDILVGIFAKGKEPFSITEPFTIIASRTAAEICQDFDLQEGAKAHLSEEPTPEQFMERLVRDNLFSDAVRFLVYALPERQAVWWTCLCTRTVPCGDQISVQALQAAEAWAKDPAENSREAALVAGRKHNFEMPGAPAAWAAMAAGWSSGAAASTNEDEPAPPEHLTAHAASGAIILTATAEPDRANEVYRKFLETGVQIAQEKMQISA